VVASSLDRDAGRHIALVDESLEQARRRVLEGRHVVLFVDSLTRMARAFNAAGDQSGRTLSGGLDARTMQRPREFFGAARNVAGGGSLTIVATVLVDTGSRMDQVIFEEFKGTGNMELVLDRTLADRRVFPAIDLAKSGTRKEEKLRAPEELEGSRILRRAVLDRPGEEGVKELSRLVAEHATNAELLRAFRDRAGGPRRRGA